MRKKVFGRQFKRDKNERKALFKGLLSSFVLNSEIKTTEAKAKAIKGEAEKLITKVKRNGEGAYSLLTTYLTSEAIKKLISDVTPRFPNRRGGYTRIVKLGRRFSDSASMVLLQWVEGEIKEPEVKNEEVKEEKKVEDKKTESKEKEEKPKKREIKKKEVKK